MLQTAAAIGHAEIARRFLNKGIDIDEVHDNENRSPLYLAAEYDNKKPIECSCVQGETPMSFVVMGLGYLLHSKTQCSKAD